MRNFFAMMVLAVSIPACGSDDGNSLGSDAGSAGGLPSSTTGTVGGVSVTYVGPTAPSNPTLPANGSCKIPDIAMHLPQVVVDGPNCAVPSNGTSCGPTAKTVSLIPSPMKYFVNTGDDLYCTVGEAISTYDPVLGWVAPTNLDFSQAPLKGLTCQELVSDTPNALQQIPSIASKLYPNSSHVVECCELVKKVVGGGFDGYVESYGVGCGNGIFAGYSSGPPISGALCSGTGEFMGWACLVS